MIIKPDEEFVLNPIDAHGVGFGRPCPDNCPILQDGANIRVVGRKQRICVEFGSFRSCLKGSN